MISNRILSPAIFERNEANCIFNIIINQSERQEPLIVQPSFAFGENFKSFILGSQQTLNIIKEQVFEWRFRPYESGKNEMRLIIYGLDANNDIVLDDYNSRINIEQNGVAIYSKRFNVYSFTEFILFWFAIISTIGAIADIINLILSILWH